MIQTEPPPVVIIPEPSIPMQTGGPPYPAYSSDPGKYGLSILDWFAGHALTGLMSNTLLVDREYLERIPEIGTPQMQMRAMAGLQKMEIRGSLDYTYNDPIVPPPMSGRFRLNNINPRLATLLWIHKTTENGVDATSFLNSVRTGWRLYVQKQDATDIWQIYGVDLEPINYTDYFEYKVTSLEGSGMFTKLDKTTFTFFEPGPEPSPVTSDQLVRAAYYVAAWMVQLRSELPIDPAPVPVTPEEPVEPLAPPLPL